MHAEAASNLSIGNFLMIKQCHNQALFAHVGSLYTFGRAQLRLQFLLPLDVIFLQIMTSLQDLPTVLIHHIVAFVPDHITLCQAIGMHMLRDSYVYIQHTSIWNTLYQC